MKKNPLGKKPKNIRSGNRQLIIDLYRKNDELSISGISGKIKLSRTTVMKINESLLREGMILETGKGSSTTEGGKKPAVFSLNKDKYIIVTFHIRYRKICLKVFNFALEAVFSETKSIAEEAPFDSILQTISVLYTSAEKVIENMKSRILSVMVAVHGTVDTEQGICHHSTYFPSWGGNLPIETLIRRELKMTSPVYIDNWIRFKAYAETNRSETLKNQNLILIDAGWHGITSGILINGKPYKGLHYISGEIGHMILDLSDQGPCACGARGCFESLISCRRLVNDAKKQQGLFPDSLIFTEKTDDEAELLERIFQGANSGDTLARSLIDKRINIFAQGLANVSVVLDPDIIILDGDYATSGPYFQSRLRELLKTITLPRLEKNMLLEFKEKSSMSSGTLEGAADYAINHYFLKEFNK